MSSVDYNMLISTLESTVVTEYVKEDMPVYTYQSEADLEREFIKNLQNQGYEYLIIHNEKELIANLKDKLEKLNNIIFSEKITLFNFSNLSFKDAINSFSLWIIR